MSSLFSPVLACHELSFVSSSSVIRFAVSSGIEVNKDTTSKDIIISSGSYIYIYIYIYGSVLVNKMPKSARYHIDRANSIYIYIYIYV